MEFPAPKRRTRSESIVPMINVVFLLLIFFLMTAQIAPPEPFDVTPPRADTGAPAQGPLTLYLSPEGTPGFGDTRGDEALTALAQAMAQSCAQPCEPSGREILLRADAQSPATALTRLMPQLAAMGLTRVQLITVAP